MKEVKEELVEEICKITCRRKKFIILLVKICEDNNIKNIAKCVKEVCQNKST